MNSDAPTVRPEDHVDPEAMDPPRQIFTTGTALRPVREVVWTWACGLFFLWVPNRFIGWRRWLLRRFGASISATAFIDRTVLIRCPWNLTMDSGAVVHHGVILDCMGSIALGRGSRISQYSHLCTRTHDYGDQAMRVLSKPIVVNEFVWVAADAYVGPGVTIGERTIVGARSSVLRDLPPGVTAVGEPARPIGSQKIVADEAKVGRNEPG